MTSDLEPAVKSQLSLEQERLDVMYALLDEQRAAAADALRQAERATGASTPSAVADREAFVTFARERSERLLAVEQRLCFGRLDLDLDPGDRERRYIGRVGLADAEGTRVLLDWRSAAAEPFYRATAARPDGVVLRRHLITTGRRVTGLDDDVLDVAAVQSGDFGDTVTGDGALMMALGAARTGRMRDIVATIQAEQDEIVRSPLPGVLVVQGGPGTGKTVVALHRVAYLLYAHRDRIARSGVLLIGPNLAFLRYIDQVLPALGETSVVMSTARDLLPGISADGDDDAEAAVVKGDLRMVPVLAEAVRRWQRLPPRRQRLRVEGVEITLNPDDVRSARGRARASRRTHNQAREVFVRELLSRLVNRLARAQGLEDAEADRDHLLGLLRDSPDVRKAVNWCWFPLSSRQVLATLYADPARLADAARALSAAERAALRRPRGSQWTVADVALLDELAELLGDDSELAGSVHPARIVSGGDFAEVDFSADAGIEKRTVTQAGTDRTWAYGHVVVDEAQELSAMQWRVILRRCPSRSLTIVGDIAQTSSPAGAASWAQMLDPQVPRWRQQELTVNYRTPGRIMDVAVGVLHAAGVDVSAPTSAREGDWEPVIDRAEVVDAAAIVAAVRAERDGPVGGQHAVIVTDDLLASVRAALAEESGVSEVSVLTAAGAKGLEFDVVILVEPTAILDRSSRGLNDLYVAMTRPTQRLRVVHSQPLPPGFEQRPGA